ncbi:super-infection exclusion protein B [Mesorhizobium sp. M0579]|uniref:super-infection exclusion protein B n=1 Tax=Mesorhizobium sp. M0579 TaxID=2956962 RepID=UPI003338ECED
MPEWLTNLFSLTREISSKVALPIFATLALVLFLPDVPARALGILQFREAYRIWIGVLFLLSAAALISNLLWVIGRFIKPWVTQWLYIREHRKSLQVLTEDEKIILRSFIVDGAASVSANMNSGPINLLVNKDVVVRASDLSLRYTVFSYLLQPWAREYLENNRNLLN